jgi:hypothetical protein
VTTCFLREGSDYLADAVEHGTIASAQDSYLRSAKELAGYGQKHDATIHIAKSVEELNEYPDYVLSLGPKGGLVCQKA